MSGLCGSIKAWSAAGGGVGKFKPAKRVSVRGAQRLPGRVLQVLAELDRISAPRYAGKAESRRAVSLFLDDEIGRGFGVELDIDRDSAGAEAAAAIRHDEGE